MLEPYRMTLPKVVYSGENALSKISTIVKGIKKVTIFTDQGIVKAGLLTYPLELLKKGGVEVFIIDSLSPEPTCDQAQSIIECFQAQETELIIAIGGGSVMDIAKLASVTPIKTGVRHLLENPQLAHKTVKTLMIPTTAGTGAEATPNSIVVVPEKELKVGIVNELMIPDFVILDGVLIKDLPLSIAAATGVDALCHAIECFTSKKANPFSDLFALEALDLIMNNIEKACLDPEAMAEKNGMLLGSFYAGVAIASSGTTAVHALSYPLGGKYRIPHGVSNAMLLVPVMQFNESKCSWLLAKVYDRVVKGGSKLTETEKSEWVIERLGEIVKNLEIPTSLSDFGIKADELDVLVNAGMDVKRLLVNNRRTLSSQDAREIYLQIM